MLCFFFSCVTKFYRKGRGHPLTDNLDENKMKEIGLFCVKRGILGGRRRNQGVAEKQGVL